jgi:hypothetical protein
MADEQNTAATPEKTAGEVLPLIMQKIDEWWLDARQHVAGLDVQIHNKLYAATQDLKNSVRSVIR